MLSFPQDEPRVTAPGQGTRRVLSLMYHDVVDGLDSTTSGFSGKHAEIYKLSRRDFALHLAAVGRAATRKLARGNGAAPETVILTFDDGGASAYHIIAPMLEQHGWHGCFFVSTAWIGEPGFLTADQIWQLDCAGHTIGSHSHSHPRRMSRLGCDRLVTEWRSSIERLEQIVHHSVTIASLPGGDYSRPVADAAAAAGIQTLFTSEPTTRPHVVNGCRVLGRYTIQRSMGPEWSGGIASGRWAPRLRQALLWKAKRAAKTLAGETYFRLQERVYSADRNC